MKMKYVKPTVIVERFTLTQNIAAYCAPRNEKWGHAANQSDKTVCAWIFPDGTKPWVANSSCEDIYNADDPFLGLCYNNPNGGMQIFGS